METRFEDGKEGNGDQQRNYWGGPGEKVMVSSKADFLTLSVDKAKLSLLPSPVKQNKMLAVSWMEKGK